MSFFYKTDSGARGRCYGAFAFVWFAWSTNGSCFFCLARGAYRRFKIYRCCYCEGRRCGYSWKKTSIISWAYLLCSSGGCSCRNGRCCCRFLWRTFQRFGNNRSNRYGGENEYRRFYLAAAAACRKKGRVFFDRIFFVWRWAGRQSGASDYTRIGYSAGTACPYAG